MKLSLCTIRKLGFEWPKHVLLEKYMVPTDNVVDMDAAIREMRSSQAYYRRQLNQAFNFKMSTGADYSDFTDRFDEYAREERDLAEAISYLERILRAAGE